MQRKTKRTRKPLLSERRAKRKVKLSDDEKQALIDMSKPNNKNTKKKPGNYITDQIRAGKKPIELPAIETKRLRKKGTDIFKRKDWKTMILKMMSEGASKSEVFAELGITSKQSQRILLAAREKGAVKNLITYAETLERGQEISEAWWNAAGRKGLTAGKQFNSHLFFMNMKNRYGWGDNMKVDLGEETLKTMQDSIVAIAKGVAVTVPHVQQDEGENKKTKKKKVQALDI